MEPIIALNLKTYPESLGIKGAQLCQIASEVSLLTGVRIIVAPQTVDLRDAAQICGDAFAQHVDAAAQGAFTGSVTVESIKEAGCKGSLVNHSEKRLPGSDIAATIERLTGAGLESILCTKDTAESAKLAFEIGFDAVDIKACHRYLVNELLAAHTREGLAELGYAAAEVEAMRKDGVFGDALG